ncbi:hypothetical protein DCAR_0831872 [Daucus carota subsp. sativus]|uniref:Uncharacterized protein n=1 Tax=Daucus carota subsp. sativus TaxID=79200 RepID=A0A175YP85_DAUCS|nr:PREDICTED: uncharacterized protein LOC108199197 [Daucus carota subsp. sativus]XP_017222421.1 PREDICTED: uncharacterized protein LOC108199197 [Daucus carota subsp. sativus]WOH12369.1 hypothetical protein DCAR_0831872 [Daucus carota subsp. sativus]
MAASMRCNKPRGGIRSISLPCRPHSSTYKMDQELNKLKTWEAEVSTNAPTAETICNGLSGLGELYRCTDDLLNLPLTQQALSALQHDDPFNELLDGSIRFLDICGSAKDIMSQVKVNAADLHSCLRRRPKGDPSSFTKYTLFRKKINKDAKRLAAVLNQLDNRTSGSQFADSDQHLISVIRVLNEVTATTISVFNYVLVFLATSTKVKSTKWSLVSRFMHKNRVACEDHQQMNEMEKVDAELSSITSGSTKESGLLKQRLEALEAGVEGIENELECMFRHIVRIRTSLLNIVSQ